MSREQQLYGYLDGDDFEYHQDFQEDPLLPFYRSSFIIPLFLAAIPVIYQILYKLDYDLLPFPELLWNILVYLTPSRLLDVAERYKSPLQITNPMLRGIPRTHAMKSEAMRKLLGLDTPGGIMGSVASAGRRRLSSLPGINLVAQGNTSRPAGLGNWDNSCYQNSVLQGLASLDSLSEYLTPPNFESGRMTGEEKPEMQMAEALRELIATLNDPSNNGQRIWTPATLKNMSSWQQQDAQEYFSKVLDEIDKEVGKAAESTRTNQGFESDSSSDSSGTTKSKAISRNPLEGMIAQRVGCTKCGYSEGLSMIPFNCLTVPLGRAWEYHVADCLDENTKLEQIEGVECGKCTLLKHQRLLATIAERAQDLPEDAPLRAQTTERLAAVNEALETDDYDDKTLLNKCKIPSKSRVSSTKTRQAVIARPPKSLVIHFNRSLFDELTGDLKKNHAEVRFPKLLDLGRWCLGSSGKAQSLQSEEWDLNPESSMIAGTAKPSRLYGPLYEIRAVVTHYGRHENGHYICYRKHGSVVEGDEEKPVKEQWWRLSDDEVTKASEENVLNQGGVFMLFFDLIEPARVVSTEQVASTASSKATAAAADSISLDQPANSVEISMIEDLELAASIPLPSFDDEDLDDYSEIESTFTGYGSPHTNREESVATSISEYDEEETVQEQSEPYSPTKAIVVPPYIGQPSSGNVNGEEARQPSIVPSGSLVMV